jgi:hypothetical protein
MKRACAACCLSFFIATGTARADPSVAERAAAEALFREGKSLVASGKTSEACTKFEESGRIDPKLGTLLHIATCHELEGRTASAWVDFNNAAAMASQLKQSDREKLARAKALALEAILSKISLVVSSAAPGQETTLDGTPLRDEMLRTAFPIDPGEHEIKVTAPSKRPWSLVVTVPPGPTTVSVEVPPLDDAAPAPLPLAEQPRETPARGSSARTIGWALLGTSAIGLGVGTVFGLRAAAEASDAKAVCPERACPTSEGVAMHESAARSATVATVGFAAGLAAAGGGLYFVLTARTANTTANIQLIPRISLKDGGLDARIRF